MYIYSGGSARVAAPGVLQGMALSAQPRRHPADSDMRTPNVFLTCS